MEFGALHHEQIEPDPSNVRRHFKPGSISELAESISEYGMLENLVVRHAPGERDKFHIVAGERRWRAIGQLINEGRRGPSEPVAVVVIDGEGTFENLVENLCREEVLPWELGFRFNELSEAGYTQNEIAARTGKNQGFVSRMSTIARGLHPASIDLLNKMRTKLTISDLTKVAGLLDADKKPDEKAQADLIGILAGTRKHRKRRKACRTDTQKLTRRLNYMKDEMKIPRHAQTLVTAIVAYLTGATRTVNFPEEF